MRGDSPLCKATTQPAALSAGQRRIFRREGRISRPTRFADIPSCHPQAVRGQILGDIDPPRANDEAALPTLHVEASQNGMARLFSGLNGWILEAHRRAFAGGPQTIIVGSVLKLLRVSMVKI